MICLPKIAAQTFKQKIKSGVIDPGKLMEMNSAQRRAFFSKLLGESNAKHVNAMFESKMLLKNQQQGIITWAKQLSGIKPEVRRDIMAKVSRMTEVLEPRQLDAFLADLAEQRLGFGVSMDEATKIAQLAKKADEAKARGGDRMEYGKAKVEFHNYVNELKLEAEKMTFGEFKQNPIKSTGKVIVDVGGQAKSITASMDNSAIFNQGWKVLWTNPNIWRKNALKTYSDIARSLKGTNIMDEVNADIVSRPTYDLMQQAKLAVGTTEEAFPSALPEKVPVLGRAYKASQDTYTAFVHRTRADVFDKMIQIAEKTGVDLSKAELESIGKFVNSLTGRGHLGVAEPVANVANNLLFSPRFLKSNIDVFTQPISGAGGSNFVRVQAAKNLGKIVLGTATVLAVADALKPGSVEWDPRSADYGSIRVGNTRFKIGGGMPGIVTLVARLKTNSQKSSTTGKIIDYEKSVYDDYSRGDAFWSFLFNKASPLAGAVRDWSRGSDFDGNKPTPESIAKNLLTPFPVKTYAELTTEPGAADTLLSMILAAHGINVSTYGGK